MESTLIHATENSPATQQLGLFLLLLLLRPASFASGCSNKVSSWQNEWFEEQEGIKKVKINLNLQTL